MSIRYVRDGLRVVRIQTVAALTELHRQAADAEGEARDFKHRVQALKAGLLADHARRVSLEARVREAERAGAPLVDGDAVRRARLRAGLSQRDLAGHLRLSRSSVAEAERGVRLPLPRLAAWAAGVLRAVGELPKDGEAVAS